METSNNIEHDQMETIRVRKLNHSTLRLECDRGVGAELREFFSFFVPGFRFMPAYKNRLWDGKIRLYNQITGEILAGLFPQVLSFAESREYELEIEETEYGNPNEGNEINADFMMKFVEALKLPFEIRDYQFDALCTGIQRKNAILLSPTGSGKSLIIYVLMRYLLSSDDKKDVLIIVPTTSLVEQIYSDFESYG